MRKHKEIANVETIHDRQCCEEIALDVARAIIAIAGLGLITTNS